jgi:hypothetical protein
MEMGAMEDFHKEQLGSMLRQVESLRQQVKAENQKVQSLLAENAGKEKETWVIELKDKTDTITQLESEIKRLTLF